MYTDLEIEGLWNEFGNVRFKALLEDIQIAEDWFKWGAGTSIYEIRAWFNDNHSQGLEYLQKKL